MAPNRRGISRPRYLATLVLTSFALSAATAAPAANAAPLSPSAQFAFNVVTNELGTGSCATVDAQIVPSFGNPEIVAEYSELECWVYLSRDLAGSLAFFKTCKTLWNVIGSYSGLPWSEGVPDLCLSRGLFLMNHPDYLRRRFP
jgi:hypothetical protein